MQLVRDIRPEAIFAFAAVTIEPPTLDDAIRILESGLMLGVSLLHGATECEHAPAFLHVGSFWQFNTGEYFPNSFYAAAKQAFHDMLLYYRNIRKIPAATLVLYEIFGPNDQRRKLWSTVMLAGAGSKVPLTEGIQQVSALLAHFSPLRFGKSAGPKPRPVKLQFGLLAGELNGPAATSRGNRDSPRFRNSANGRSRGLRYACAGRRSLRAARNG